MTFAAGDTLTAALLNAALAAITSAVTPLWKLKTGDESVTSNITPQDDDHLFLSPTINTTYDLEVVLFHSGAGTAIDMNVAFTFPTGANLSIGTVGPDISLGSGVSVGTGQWAASTGDTSSPSSTIALGTSSVGDIAVIKGTLIMGSTAGTLQFQWAQNQSSGTALTLKAGSWIKLTPH